MKNRTEWNEFEWISSWTRELWKSRRLCGWRHAERGGKRLCFRSIWLCNGMGRMKIDSWFWEFSKNSTTQKSIKRFRSYLTRSSAGKSRNVKKPKLLFEYCRHSLSLSIPKPLATCQKKYIRRRPKCRLENWIGDMYVQPFYIPFPS